ncbi:hypothetical protein [Hominifimenecus sp. rT4P-3]|uniref:hypothetical protein n=1 Tax=Hominifimenecus sp. rT4P-3 TaxID=3242979 RepID=UPI003DA44AD3
MRKPTRTAFYLETLLLVGALVAVALILVQCFGKAEQARAQAKELTEAVHLARNAAEAAAGAKSLEELEKILWKEPDGQSLDGALVIFYNEKGEIDPEGELSLRIDWDKIPAPEAGLVTYRITVENTQDSREIYRLETSVYLGRKTP